MSSINLGDLLNFLCLAGQRPGPIRFSNTVQHGAVLMLHIHWTWPGVCNSHGWLRSCRQAAGDQRRQRFGGLRAAEAAQKAAEYGQKENATMAQFRALLERGPIAIPKR